ncbi:MAG: hypothetical protein ACRDQF_11340 [Thermocrispum sp.]
MTTATATPTIEPTRHALAMPDCVCGMCAPTWARRRGKSKRFTQPVTLLDALHAEDPTCRPAMIEQHRQCLAAMTDTVDQVLNDNAADDLGRPEVGLALLTFAGELAAALQPDNYREQLPAEQAAHCEHTITNATLAAAGCVTGLLEAVQLLAELVG